MTGHVIKIRKGYDLELFYQLCRLEELNDITMEFANILANDPSLAYARIKKMMYETVFKHYEEYAPVEHKSQVDCSENLNL